MGNTESSSLNTNTSSIRTGSASNRGITVAPEVVVQDLLSTEEASEATAQIQDTAMASDAEDVSQKLDNLNINGKNEINILLLGETGAGKSTFINSIFNYLQFEDFIKAEKEHLNVLIPVSFMIEDKNGVPQTVRVGPKDDANEDLTSGESATQAVKTYSFQIKLNSKQVMVRLIDTPGMGDTRGAEADDKNCENILSYISRLHHLHAICYLTKSQQSRSTVYFKYCVSQILSRLEKSAGKNIIFVFTHSKGSNYTAGDTLQLLRNLTEEIKQNPAHADIPLERNSFCFDNEAFRSLAAIKNGVELSTEVRRWSIDSWNRSMKQCWKMISYILDLSPHFVHHTAAINEARRIIYQLSQPMADIAQLVNDNIEILKKRQSDLDLDKSSLADLKKKLYIPIIDLEVTKLTQPVTVCTDSSCTETYPVGEGRQENHYKTRCHDPCFLNNVPRDLVGSPELMNCACIGPDRQNCQKCSHSYRVHMHVYYFTVKKHSERQDELVSKNINTKELVIENAKRVIAGIKQRKNILEEELNTIVKCNAKFAHFLANNAISPFSDHYAEYINYLTTKERRLGPNCDLSKLASLQRLLREHNEMKKVFAEAAKNQKIIGKDDPVTPQDISQSMNELFKLTINGKKIREMFESQKKTMTKEYAYSEYLHKGVFEQSSDDRTEKKQFEKNKGQSPAQNNTTKFQRGRQNNWGNNPRGRGRAAGPPNRADHRESPPPSYYETAGYPPPNVPRNYPPANQPYPGPGPDRRPYYPPPPAGPPYIPPPATASHPPHVPAGKPNDRHTINVQVTIPPTVAGAAGGDSEPAREPPREPYYPRNDYRSPEHPDPYYRDPRDYPPPPPRGDYPARDPYYPYPPTDGYPPHDPYRYPPRDPYAPRNAYYSRDYPPRDSYPPRDPHAPRDPYYPYPPGREAPPPHYDHQPYPRYAPGGSQPQPQYTRSNSQTDRNPRGKAFNKNNRGNNNRGGINRNYRKKDHKNKNRDSNSGDDSDTSVASSVSKKK